MTTPSGTHAALVLPGPDTLTPERLAAVYDAIVAPEDDHDPFEVDDEYFTAWAAAQVAADAPEPTDPLVAAAAADYWDRWHEQQRAEESALEALAAELTALHRDSATFTAWLEAADADERAQHHAALVEHVQLRRANAHLDSLRATRAAAGAAQAQSWRDIAQMALLYRGAVQPPADAVPGTFGIPALPGPPGVTDEPGFPDELGFPDDPGLAGFFDDLGVAEEPAVEVGVDLDEALAVDGAAGAGGRPQLVAQLTPVLGLSEGMVTRRVELAPRVVWLLPHTLAALAAGTVEERHLLVVAEDTVHASAAVTRAVDEQLYGPGGAGLGPDGWALPPAALREQVTTVLGVIDQAAVRDRSRAKTAKRGTAFHRLADGMGRLEVVGPAPALLGCQERLTTLARANLVEARDAAAAGRLPADGGDPYAVPGVDGADPTRVGDASAPLAERRGINAHRFDAFVRAVGSAVPADGAPAPVVRLEMHLSLPAAVALNDDPGWREGYGPLPAWLTRTGLRGKGAVIRRLSTDPYTGDLRTVDGHTYPASWLLHPDDPASTSPRDDDGGRPPSTPPDDGGSGGGGSGDDGSGDDGSGGGGSDGRGGGGGGSGAAAAPARFRGLPVQDLPPVPTEDEAFGPPLSEEQLDSLTEALAADPTAADPCAQGTCTPLDPDGCPLAGIGGGPHDPPAALTRLVQRRWGSCTGPGSTARAGRADLDHVVAHRDDGTGGSTCSCNLEPKSRFWHGVKHAVDPTTWRSPADPTAAEVPWPKRWANWRCTHGASHYRSPLGTVHHSVPRQVAQPAPRYRTLFPVTDPTRPRTCELPALDYRGTREDARERVSAGFAGPPTY